MQIKKYSLRFQELNYNLSDIYVTLGYQPKEVPAHVVEMVSEIEKIVPQNCEIVGGYCLYDSIQLEASRVRVKEKYLSVNNMIAKQIKGSDKLAIFVCTIGDKIEKLSRKYFSEGDFPKGYIVDTFGSVLVESAMDIIQERLEMEMKRQDLKITNRYSPGYCKWDVKEQHILFSLLPDKFFGIELTKSALMLPIKSVSGIIGIGRNVKKSAYLCHICNEKDCLYRNLRRE